MSLLEEFDEWLDQLPDEDIDGFEDMAHEQGIKWAKERNDEQAMTCLTSFYGDNPREYAEDAVESITTNCKTNREAKLVVMTVISAALDALKIS